MGDLKIAVWVACLTLGFGCLSAVGAGEEAEEPGWKKELVGSANLTQATFDNWAQGGENTLGWQVTLSGKFTHVAPRHEWTNAAKIAYGMTKIGDDEARKSIDEIRFETVFTYDVGFFARPYVAATAETQFSKGYEYTDSDKIAISDFMDPGFFTQSTGLARKFGDMLQSRLGLSVKETVTDEHPVPYADDPETEEVENTKTEAGMESVTDLSLSLDENLLFESKLELFSNLEATNEIDVTWDNLLTAKVEEYLSVTLNVKMFYDRDISKRRQIKESLAIGLTYSFL